MRGKWSRQVWLTHINPALPLGAFPETIKKEQKTLSQACRTMAFAFPHMALQIALKSSFLIASGGLSLTPGYPRPLADAVSPIQAPRGWGWRATGALLHPQHLPCPGTARETATRSAHPALQNPHQNLLFSSFWQLIPTLISSYFARIFLWIFLCYQ